MHMKTTRSRVVRYLASAAFLSLLTLNAAAQAPTTESRKADPEAWNLLKSARETREIIPRSVKEITAELVFNEDGQIKRGTVSYDIQNRAVVKMEGLSEEAKAWVDDQVNSILAHRRDGDFSKGDGRHPITFAANDNENSPLGRRIELHDSLKSSYRIKNNKVVEVDRTMGNDHFVISVLETTPTSNGKYLPRHFVVNYFDAKTGALNRSESFTDEYQKVDHVWLPASRRIIKANAGTLTVRTIEFRNAKVTFSANQAAK
ncbi:MAG TPA: DUF3386 family protein [Blastocatellia bacterium]|nr:DUF3386 family protein [Blastocatellia bacterium]